MKFKTRIPELIITLIVLLMSNRVSALVMYDVGSHIIDGITFLRDVDDPNSYYYLPTAPRVALRPNSEKPDMFFVKFVDPKGGVSGGLIHFLFTLDLPKGELEVLQKKLRKLEPKAVLRGPVPLLRPAKNKKSDDAPPPSFRIISSTLTNPTKGGFTQTLVSSGSAPLTAGSRAAVAARLNEHGATLLWDSLTKPTSDVSISIEARYEAAVRGYRGTVQADLSTVYQHLFKVLNIQHNYTKAEIRKQTDELVRNGVIKVEVTDRAGLNVDSSRMQQLMNMVTDKLITMLFDTTTGLSKLPKREDESKAVPGRDQRSWLAKTFGGEKNPKYITDNQYTLRDRKDIRRGVFSLSFTKNTSIQIPFQSSGNIRGLYNSWSKDKTVFRTVNLKDASFERRDVYFEVDPSFYHAFDSVINSVSVSFVKKYKPLLDQNDFTEELVFDRNDVKAAKFSKSIRYPRLGLQDAKWLEYGYRILWNYRGGMTISVPVSSSDYKYGSAPYVTLAPPQEQSQIEIDASEPAFKSANIRRAEVEIRYLLLGKHKTNRVALQPGKGEMLKTTLLLYDHGATPTYSVRWYNEDGKSFKSESKKLDDNYIFIAPPENKS